MSTQARIIVLQMKFPSLKRSKPAAKPSAAETATSAPISNFRKQTTEAASLILLLVGVILVTILIKSYLVQPYIVDGQSMEPTLSDHDRLLVDKLPRTFGRIDGRAYIPKRGDIIIFNQSNLPGYTGSKQLIKRVIGLPGDQIVIKDDTLSIYNQADPKGFDPDFTLNYHPSTTSVMGSTDTLLGSNQVFVLGDNRNNSEDSRYFGAVNLNQIVGKLSFRIFPISKAQHF